MRPFHNQVVLELGDRGEHMGLFAVEGVVEGRRLVRG